MHEHPQNSRYLRGSNHIKDKVLGKHDEDKIVQDTGNSGKITELQLFSVFRDIQWNTTNEQKNCML